jgi:FkbM family methyltransferase
MREILWARLRDNPVLRGFSQLPLIGSLARKISYWLLPHNTRSHCRIEQGLGQGLIMVLNPRWERSMWKGVYEPEVQAVFGQYLKEEGVFYDIGSGLGFYSCVAAHKGAEVYAFEPDPANAAQIEYHAKINRLEDRLHVIRKVVSSRAGTLQLVPADRSLGHGNAVVSTATQVAAIPVESVCLDDFIRAHRPPTLCKLDVEGHESEVLKGAQQLFENVRPHLICEVHDAANAAFIEPWLKARGYVFQWIEEAGRWPRHFLASPQNQ